MTFAESVEDGLHRANSMVAMLQVLVKTLAGRAQSVRGLVAEGTPRERTEVTVIQEGWVGPDHDGDMVVHPWVQLYKEWVQIQGQLASKASDLGLLERQVRVQEAQMTAFAEALNGMLSDLGIDMGDPRTMGIIERRLLAIDSQVIEIDHSAELTAVATSS